MKNSNIIKGFFLIILCIFFSLQSMIAKRFMPLHSCEGLEYLNVQKIGLVHGLAGHYTLEVQKNWKNKKELEKRRIEETIKKQNTIWYLGSKHKTSSESFIHQFMKSYKVLHGTTPSLFDLVALSILQQEERYEVEFLNEEVKDRVRRFQKGIIYAQKGLLEEYKVKNPPLASGTFCCLRVFEEERRKYKQCDNYYFTSENIELAEVLRNNFTTLKDLRDKVSEEYYQKLKTLKRNVKWMHYKDACLITPDDYYLVGPILYLLPLAQRSIFIYRVREKAVFYEDISFLCHWSNQGFNINSLDFYHVLAYRTPSFIEFLIFQGININKTTFLEMHSLDFINLFSWRGEENNKKIYEGVVRKGADPHYKRSRHYYEEQLLGAIHQEDLRKVQDLLVRDVPFPYKWRIHPLVAAAEKGNVLILQVLLNQKCIKSNLDYLEQAQEAAQGDNHVECAALVEVYKDIKKIKESKKKRRRDNKDFSFDFLTYC